MTLTYDYSCSLPGLIQSHFLIPLSQSCFTLSLYFTQTAYYVLYVLRHEMQLSNYSINYIEIIIHSIALDQLYLLVFLNVVLCQHNIVYFVLKVQLVKYMEFVKYYVNYLYVYIQYMKYSHLTITLIDVYQGYITLFRNPSLDFELKRRGGLRSLRFSSKSRLGLRNRVM